MPSLIVHTDERTQAGQLSGPVLLGRKSFNMVVIDHDAVSRIHAWIVRHDGRWVVGDCGSRNGTRLNGHRIRRAVPLSDGDAIGIGRTTITYRDSDTLPADAEPLDLGRLDERTQADESGFLAWCACGAPVWAPNFLRGCRRTCGHCGQPIELPATPAANNAPRAVPPAPSPPPVSLPTPAPAPASAPAPSAALCSICQCQLDARDTEMTCPDCGVRFHHDCWNENQGCSTYGCGQVNVLAEPPSQVMLADAATWGEHAADTAHHTPRPYLYLAASVAAAIVGALTFGTPALIVLLAAITYLLRHKPGQWGVVLASVLVALLGLVAGVVLSYHWWMH